MSVVRLRAFFVWHLNWVIKSLKHDNVIVTKIVFWATENFTSSYNVYHHILLFVCLFVFSLEIYSNNFYPVCCLWVLGDTVLHVKLISDSKYTVAVDVNINGCLHLFVSFVMDCLLCSSPSVSWQRLESSAALVR